LRKIILIYCLILILIPFTIQEREEHKDGEEILSNMTDLGWYQFVYLRAMENTKAPESLHDMIENPTYGIYFVDLTDNKWYKTTDEGVNVDEVEDRGAAVWQYANWHDRSNNLLYVLEVDGTTLAVWKLDLSDDSTAELGEPDNTKHHGEGGDIFLIGTDIFVIAPYYNAGAAPDEVSVEVYKYTDPGWNLEASQLIFAKNAPTWALSYVTIIGTNVYFVTDDDAADEAEIWKYDTVGKGFTKLDEISGYAVPSSRVNRATSYDGSDRIYFSVRDAGADIYIYYYSISGDSSTQIGNIVLEMMLDRNCIGTSNSPFEFEKGFDVTNHYIFQIHKSYHYLLKLQDLGLTGGDSIRGITDTYLITQNGAFYKYQDNSANCPIFKINYEILSFPQAKFEYSTLLSSDQLFEVFENDSGTYALCFRGKLGVPKYNDQKALYQFNPVNSGFNDLFREVSYTATAEGIDEVVIALINNNCNYLYADATSVPNIATNITYTWEDQELIDVLYTIAILANGFWYFYPNGYFYFRAYSNMIDSTDSFSNSTGDCASPESKRTQQQYNTWIIEGGINPTTGKPFTKTETDDDHIFQYGELIWDGRAEFPEARTQANLDAIATALKAWQGMQNNPDDAIFMLSGKYYYPIGKKANYQWTELTQFATAQDMCITRNITDLKSKGLIKLTLSTNITREE